MLDNYDAYVRRNSAASGSKATRASLLTARLRAAILRGDLKPGQKVNLDRIRDELGVSLSPLREAISRLAVDGLVQTQDQRGSRIAPLTHCELTEIGRLRREVDVLALRTAIKYGKDEWAGNLRKCSLDFHAASRDSTVEHFDEIWSVAHTRFHQALIQGCQMPMLIAFCVNLHDLHDRYRRQLLRSSKPWLELWREHAEIATHALNGDTDAATEALRDHLDVEIAGLAEQLVKTA